MDIENVITSIDWKDKLNEYFIHTGLDISLKAAVGTITNALNFKNSDPERLIPQNKSTKNYPIWSILNSNEEIWKAIEFQLIQSRNWCLEIKFDDLEENKSIESVFLHLDFYLTPKKVWFEDEIPRRIPQEKALNFNSSKNYIILGVPGAGKTTLMKFITYNILSKKEGYDIFSFPIVIRLKSIDYNNTEFNLFSTLLDIFHLRIGYFKDDDFIDNQNSDFVKNNQRLFQQIIIDFIEELKVLIIFDGFDEIPSSDVKETFMRDINSFSLSLVKSKFIVTSRTAEFNKNIDNSNLFEISPLNDIQVRNFLKKWIKNKVKVHDLYNQISNSTFFDTVRRPLTLAHLCAIYERYGKIPEKPKSIYDKVVELLLEKWNAQNSLNRQSKYSNFDVDRKRDFLVKIAYLLTIKHFTSIFYFDQLKEVYLNICLDFNLPENEVALVINEIESHNGLILQVGHNRFEFAHKSIQEYLTAKYLRELKFLPKNVEMLQKIPNELAVSIASSQNPSEYFGLLFLTRFYGRIDPNFVLPFLERLIIEIPDFECNPILALSICVIDEALLKYKYSKVAANEVTHYMKGEINPNNFEKIDIDNRIKSILSHPNVKRSFNEFNNNFHFIGIKPINRLSSYKFPVIAVNNSGKIYPELFQNEIPLEILISEYLYNYFKGDYFNLGV